MQIRLTTLNGDAVLEARLKALDQPPDSIEWQGRLFQLAGQRGDLWQYLHRPDLAESTD